jgi:hypothetical protein
LVFFFYALNLLNRSACCQVEGRGEQKPAPDPTGAPGREELLPYKLITFDQK